MIKILKSKGFISLVVVVVVVVFFFCSIKVVLHAGKILSFDFYPKAVFIQRLFSLDPNIYMTPSFIHC